MTLDEKMMFDVKTWSLTTEKVGDLLYHAAIEPREGSPFIDMKLSTLHLKSTDAAHETPEMIEALRSVAQPEVVLSLVHYPPAEPEFYWFYAGGGDQAYVSYRRQDDEHHLASPIRDVSLLQILDWVLDIEEQVVTNGFRLSLDLGSFGAFVAIIDVMQEEALRSLIDRKPVPKVIFDLDGLYTCYQRSLQGKDLRWMAQLGQFIAPTRLKPGLESLNQGLEFFVEQGMLKREGDLYRPEPRFGLICSLLGDCAGLCAISRRFQMEEQSGKVIWKYEHVAALRGIDSLWLFEFTDVTSEEFKLEIMDTTSVSLHQRLAAILRLPSTVSMTSMPKEELSPAETPVQIVRTELESGSSPLEPSGSIVSNKQYCRNCGHIITPEDRFCRKCGAELQI